MTTKSKQIFILSILMITLSGCGNTENVQQSITVSRFEKDSNTIKNVEEYRVQSEYQTAIEEEQPITSGNIVIEPTVNIAEVEIVQSSDIEEQYYTDGSNIVYNGNIFIGLQTCISSIEQYSNYSAEELIGFILTTYETDEDVTCITDIDYEQSSRLEYGSLANSISKSYYGYDAISDLYNEDVIWSLKLIKNNSGKEAYMLGCTQYTLIANLTESISVDIHQFVPSIEENLIDNIEDTDEDTEAGTEQNEEDTEQNEENTEQSENNTVETDDNESEESTE